jgi:hypothetical protein
MPSGSRSQSSSLQYVNPFKPVYNQPDVQPAPETDVGSMQGGMKMRGALTIAAGGLCVLVIPTAVWSLRQTMPAHAAVVHTDDTGPVQKSAGAPYLPGCIRGDLFGPAPTAAAATLRRTVIPPPEHTHTVPADASPLSGWDFTGTAEFNGEEVALLEHRASGEGRFVKRGDRFGEGIVLRFSRDELQMTCRGQTFRISRHADWSLSPHPEQGPVRTAKPSAAAEEEDHADAAVAVLSTVQETDFTSTLGVKVRLRPGPGSFVTPQDRDDHFEGRNDGEKLRAQLGHRADLFLRNAMVVNGPAVPLDITTH